MRHSAIVRLACLFLFASTSARAATQIWLADDGARIAPSTRPSDESIAVTDRGVRLFAIRGETIALQVAIRSDGEPLESVTVDVQSLESQGFLSTIDFSIDRFVVFSIASPLQTRNGWSDDEETLGWASTEARPAAPPLWIPDALIPVRYAAHFAAYPLRIPPHTTAAVWIDVLVPDHAQEGRHRATIRVADGRKFARTLPIEIDIKPSKLPFRAVKTTVFYDLLTLRERIGTASAELDLWRLLHSHHLTPMLSTDDESELARFRSAIDGSAYLRDMGYRGPGEGVGDDVVVLGSYGSLGEPSQAALPRVSGMVHALAKIRASLFVFLYAIDETCESDRAARWRKLLRRSEDPLLAALRIGETCHLRAPGRAADLVMVPSAAFRRDEAEEARAAGQWVWVYNGQRPRSGPMMLDAPSVDLRANGWIASAFAIDRWFYWESTFWNDTNAGGQGHVDPFSTTDSFHNSGGDAALGDGLLVYPGKQLAFPEHSLGHDGLLPSIRLKSLRRGVQDAGYVALVASQDPGLAARIVQSVIPLALDEVPDDRRAPAWPSDSSAFLEARRALWEAIPPDLELDDRAVETALSQAASARRRKVDPKVEDRSASFAIAMLLAAAASSVFRRANSQRR